MEKVYFVSYVVESTRGNCFDMFEVKLPRKIRNFNDVKAVGKYIEDQLAQRLEFCRVTVLNWKELDEPMEIQQEELKENK
ncbi:hypothetical protein UT300003_32960 [Clostridium sardiniense]